MHFYKLFPWKILLLFEFQDIKFSLKVDLKIYGGSGRFFVRGSDEEIASVTAKKSIVKVSFIV